MSESNISTEIQVRAINAAFDECGVGFKGDRADVLAAFKNGDQRSLTIGDDGKVYTRYDSEYLELNQALTRFAFDNPHLIDRRTLPREDQGKGRPGAASKADFTTTAQKSAYILQHGLSAWESLPTKPPVTSEVVFQDDFFRLPLKEKSRRLAENPDLLSTLPVRPKPLVKINQAAIDRQKSKYQREVEAQQRADILAGS